MTAEMLLTEERIAIFTPLGIRFWDPVLDVQIRNALLVTARPADHSGAPIHAYQTGSDIYAFQGLPGLRSIEYPDAQTDAANPIVSPPQTKEFIIEVHDALRRYLPAAFSVALPLSYRGIFLANSPCSPLEANPSGFHLYSAPTRPVPAWIASIRGRLEVQGTGSPAAFALIKVDVTGSASFYGIADETGQLLVFMPYPTTVAEFQGSPAVAGGTSLFAQSWAISLQVRYEPNHLTPLAGTSVPDYLSILCQEAAQVWAVAPDDGGTQAPQWLGTLEFGKELIVRTEGLEESKLLISPAESSP